MSRKSQLNSSNVKDFYFRRVKRILPEYLFVICVTLLVISQRVSSIDYGQIVDETLSSILFVSNIPSTREFTYFDVVSYFPILKIYRVNQN